MVKMKKTFISLLFLVCIFVIPYKVINALAENKIYTDARLTDSFVDNHVMVILNDEASCVNKEYSRRDFPNVGCRDVSECDFSLNDNNNSKKILCLELKKHSKQNVLDICNELMKRDDVYCAEPDFIMKTSAMSNDSYINNQWALNSISLPQTWEYETGSANVLVGVLDTGIDFYHSDLKQNLDSSLSKNFVISDDENSIYDYNGHGTHVSGIIGAVGNNMTGICGTNWCTKIVTLKVADMYGCVSSEVLCSAISYANKENIKILNLSISINSESNKNMTNTSLDIAIKSYNGLIICSAGNKGVDIDGDYFSYPSECDANNIISVGSITNNNNKSDFSNYGLNSVDIYAPGQDILSTWDDYACAYNYKFNDGTRVCELPVWLSNILISMVEDNNTTWDNVKEFFYDKIMPDYNITSLKEIKNSTHCYKGYHYMDGTSMATPYVTGVAALLLSHNPNLTSLELKNAILNGADILTISTSGGQTQNVRKLNALNSINLVHECSNTITSRGHICTYTCGCDYTVSEPHDFKYTWISTTKHKAKCSCGYTNNEPHAVVSGSSICVLCGGKVDIGFIGIYSLRNRQYISSAGSYISPNGVIVLMKQDLDTFLKERLLV